ncbi:hypothetical protein HY414_00945 [Candidatus Kaiserbacteria bacterium]|nr:hypothetical protein [Candidatus Kaiserbacteria bacterium]
MLLLCTPSFARATTKLVGAGDSNMTTIYVSESESFLYKVGTAFQFDQIVNLGKSGEGSGGLYGRINTVLAENPTRLIVMEGTNEIASGVENGTLNAPIIASHVANMEKVIDAAQAAGVPITVLSPIASRNYLANARMADLVEALRALCNRKGVHFIDLYNGMMDVAKNGGTASFEALFFPDPDKYHLNAAGHAWVANYIIKNSILPHPSSPPPPLPPPPPPPPPTGTTTVYAAINPNEIVIQSGSLVILSNNNLTYTGSGNIFEYRTWYVDMKPVSGSYYFEMHVDGVGTVDPQSQNISVIGGGRYNQNGTKGANIGYGTPWAVGDVIGVAVSPAGTWFSRNGIWQNNATVAEIESGDAAKAAAGPTSYPFKIYIGDFSATTGSYNSGTFNFGQGSIAGSTYWASANGNFKYEPPSGFKAISSNTVAVREARSQLANVLTALSSFLRSIISKLSSP